MLYADKLIIGVCMHITISQCLTLSAAADLRKTVRESKGGSMDPQDPPP